MLVSCKTGLILSISPLILLSVIGLMVSGFAESEDVGQYVLVVVLGGCLMLPASACYVTSSLHIVADIWSRAMSWEALERRMARIREASPTVEFHVENYTSGEDEVQDWENALAGPYDNISEDYLQTIHTTSQSFVVVTSVDSSTSDLPAMALRWPSLVSINVEILPDAETELAFRSARDSAFQHELRAGYRQRKWCEYAIKSQQLGYREYYDDMRPTRKEAFHTDYVLAAGPVCTSLTRCLLLFAFCTGLLLVLVLVMERALDQKSFDIKKSFRGANVKTGASDFVLVAHPLKAHIATQPAVIGSSS